MADLYRQAKESLDVATRAVSRLSDGPTGGVTSGRDVLVNQALITLLDAVAQVARVVGVPDAIEPDPGAKPHVTTS